MAAPPQQESPPALRAQGSPAPGTPAHPAYAPPRPTLGREWLLLTLSILVLAGVILPPLINLGRYQHRVADAMSRSLGRPVSMRSVTLRLFPTPALVLADVLVHEQPGFGAEPILLAPSLTADLRLSSLWRGRFEVSRVEMSDASLNLVRNADGRWNIGSVLVQASHVPNAPTAQRRAGPTPRFPYIAITDSRVNLKQGVEKLPYTLLNANLSMWLEQPEVWQLKLDAQPVRTDLALGLADTGLLRVEGRLHRAPIDGATGLGHLPLTLHADWTNAPLGQASRLLLGRDRGWRGEVHATADLSGELDNLALQTHLGIANLHREEFSPAEPFSVDATCRTLYRRQARALDDLVCRWPVGAGQLLLRGSLAGASLAGGGSPDAEGGNRLELIADQLPASFLSALLGLVETEAAPTARLAGTLAGSLIYTAHPGQPANYAGALESPSVQITAPGLEEPLTLTHLRLAPALPSPTGAPTLVLSADPVDLGGAAPVTANVQLTRQGFLVHAGGSAAIARLADLGHSTNLLPASVARLAPEGALDFDLTHTAAWQPVPSTTDVPIPDVPIPGVPTQDLAAPAHRPETAERTTRRRRPGSAPTLQPDASLPPGTQGWLRLRNASYAPPFLSGAVSLPAAQATLLPGSITWTVPSAVFHRLPVQATATYPLNCRPAQPCVAHFHLSFGSLDAADLTTALLGSDPSMTPGGNAFADLIRIGPAPPGWPAVYGTVHADTFTLGRLTLHQASATISIHQHEAAMEALDAKTLGGILTGTGALLMQGHTLQTTLDTVLTAAGASAAGALFHEDWGPGTITLRSHLQLSGLRTPELTASATGNFQADWAHGALGSQTTAPTPFAHFPLWSAAGTLAGQKLILSESTLTVGAGKTMPVTGAIGFDRALSLRIGATEVNGTLAQPR